MRAVADDLTPPSRPLSARKHLATQWLIAGTNKSVLRCKCGEWESDRDALVKVQREAHRAHRVEMGETVSGKPPKVLMNLTAEEAELVRQYRNQQVSAQ